MQLLHQIIPWILACINRVSADYLITLEPKLGKYLNYSAAFAAYWKAALLST